MRDFFARQGKVWRTAAWSTTWIRSVKAPKDSKGAWDFYKHLATIPGDEAFAIVAESGWKL